jgi:hypothetical protein
MTLMGFTYGPLGTFLSELFQPMFVILVLLAFNMVESSGQHCTYDCDLAGDTL